MIIGQLRLLTLAINLPFIKLRSIIIAIAGLFCICCTWLIISPVEMLLQQWIIHHEDDPQK